MSRSVRDRFVAVGHIVNDTDPHDHLGGAVSYSAVAARRLGYEAHIITKCPPDHHYIDDLKQMGVQVHPLPTKLDTITSFRNTYDRHEGRKQRVSGMQEAILFADFPAFPQDILDDATVLVAPIIGEVDVNLYSALARSKMLAVTPQGYFRDVDSAGTVIQKRWSGFEDSLRQARATVFSTEDISIGSDESDQRLLKAIVAVCPVVVLTLGARGALIYEDGKATHVGAFSLSDDEINDLTGAGDTFAAVFVTELASGVSTKAAAISAAFFAALKIRRPVQGVDSIPTFDEVVRFRDANQERVQTFLGQESISNLSLFDALDGRR
jgi:sugar/nucleoside kinase (ribokinase family)